jgi:uncharacterized protein involved in type VI secretion and phage assembly
MIKDVVKGFPSELLTYKIAPSYPETIYYIVQYKETSWQFINRLANTYGEWLYYDGQQLVVGVPRGNPVHLTHGVQLSRFAMSIQIKPNDLRAKAYDYVSNEVYDSQVENIADRAGHNELGTYAIEKSTQLYGTDTNCWYNHFVRNKKQVDEFTGTRAAMRSSDLVRMHGSSDMPGLQPGSTIAVKDPQGQSGGEFTIISIEHCWDGIGNYANEFIAIPASVKVPPLAAVNEPYCEMQSAVVIDNHDVKGMGRVQVRFRWMDGTEKSPWLRVVTSYAGDGKGMFFLPEKDEEVLVTFASGDATRPYVIGTVRHGKSIIGYGNEGNDIKAIHTRSGIKIVMNDETGGIYIEDKNGDKLEFNGEGNIKLLSKNKITFDCGDSKIEMDKDGTIKISAIKIDMEATEEAIIDAKTKVKVESAMITLN